MLTDLFFFYQFVRRKEIARPLILRLVIVLLSNVALASKIQV